MNRSIAFRAHLSSSVFGSEGRSTGWNDQNFRQIAQSYDPDLTTVSEVDCAAPLLAIGAPVERAPRQHITAMQTRIILAINETQQIGI
jgi:hypothetical protein